MYGIGKHIIYSSMGVCLVKDITASVVYGSADPVDCYHLLPLGSTGEIIVPVSSTVFMRPILTHEEADTLIRDIPNMEVTPFRAQGLQQLKTFYQKSLQSHEPKDLLALILGIRLKKEERLKANQRIGSIDENCMKRAQNLLYGELALSLGIPQEDVNDYIFARPESAE